MGLGLVGCRNLSSGCPCNRRRHDARTHLRENDKTDGRTKTPRYKRQVQTDISPLDSFFLRNPQRPHYNAFSFSFAFINFPPSCIFILHIRIPRHAMFSFRFIFSYTGLYYRELSSFGNMYIVFTLSHPHSTYRACIRFFYITLSNKSIYTTFFSFFLFSHVLNCIIYIIHHCILTILY